jgi:hypothetical protein
VSWNAEALPDLAGRTNAVTGGNAGTGYFISEQLATARADLVILGGTRIGYAPPSRPSGGGVDFPLPAGRA